MLKPLAGALFLVFTLLVEPGEAQATGAPQPSRDVGPLVFPPGLKTPGGSVVAQYLQAFNEGPNAMRAYLGQSAVLTPQLTLERFVQTYDSLKSRLGTIAIAAADNDHDKSIRVDLKGSTGRDATLVFDLEPSPFRLRAIRVDPAAGR
jgi:hypothetical protein